MSMVIRKAERKKAKLRLGISAPSGAGKTYSGLLIAYGITGDWEKVGMIDTEYGSGELYADLGEYRVISLEPPFTPQKYVEAIKMFEVNGFGAIVIDSLSHAWNGEGGVLEIVDKTSSSKNKFAAWRDATPMHNELVNAMLGSRCHIIATMRSKTEYILEDDGKGKKVPRKVGMAPIQRDGMEYEFTVMLDMTHDHVAHATKDRTRLLDGKHFVPSEQTGKELLEWLETGVDAEQRRKDQLEKVRSLWNEGMGFVDAEGFGKWFAQKGKTEETIRIEDLERLEEMLAARIESKARAAQEAAEAI